MNERIRQNYVKQEMSDTYTRWIDADDIIHKDGVKDMFAIMSQTTRDVYMIDMLCN